MRLAQEETAVPKECQAGQDARFVGFVPGNGTTIATGKPWRVAPKEGEGPWGPSKSTR